METYQMLELLLNSVAVALQQIVKICHETGSCCTLQRVHLIQLKLGKKILKVLTILQSEQRTVRFLLRCC